MPKQILESLNHAPQNKLLPVFLVKRLCEGAFILLLSLAIFFCISLFTYDYNDIHQVNASHKIINNAGGQVGAFLAEVFYGGFGDMAYLLPLCLVALAWFILKDYKIFFEMPGAIIALRISGFILSMLSGCGLLAILSAGGLIGNKILYASKLAFNTTGSFLLLTSLLITGFIGCTNISFLYLLEKIGKYTWVGIDLVVAKTKALVIKIKSNIAKKQETKAINPNSISIITPKLSLQTQEQTKAPKIFNDYEATEQNNIKTQAVKTITNQATPTSAYNIQPPTPPAKEHSTHAQISAPKVLEGVPALSLLDEGQPGDPMGGYTHEHLESLSRDVEQHLLDFGIQADVVAVHPGPVITRFELQLAAGVKVSKLSALAKDLARSLSVISVRVVEIIPGKTVVGLELPNQNRAMVSLSQVLSSDVYQQAHSPLSLALGVDIAGYPMIVDLAKMPHLLVAGTTGSGKSVGINAMILSLLFKASPEQVRLIMVDPKMLELSVYDGIPHLLTPVVTDMKEAHSALRWCVNEMERRYKLMASFGVRNLAGFNTQLQAAQAKGEAWVDPFWKPTDDMQDSAPILEVLPYIVVIIDELADMMMVVGKKVEQLIARIAQKARAAGIHLILATQRPSVDVLTGLIKSNIPTRISFQVSSKIDSRTILDQQGAEQLLGHGDMLFLAPGTGAPLRVHGAFVDDQEVHRVASDWRSRGEPQYIEDILQHTGELNEGYANNEDNSDVEDNDPIYDQVVEFVLQTKKASISAVQRRFKIGYNRAARLIEEMERTGLVGPMDGGVRDVLVNTEEM